MAPKQTVDHPQYLDEHHQRISEFAADYFDDEEERDEFVKTLMSRRGYKPTTGWALPDPVSPNGGGGGEPPPAPPKTPYFKR